MGSYGKGKPVSQYRERRIIYAIPGRVTKIGIANLGAPISTFSGLHNDSLVKALAVLHFPTAVDGVKFPRAGD